MSDSNLLTIIAIVVLGHIVLGFAWLFYKIFKKK